MGTRVESEADLAVRQCLDDRRSFAMVAGAGSGKTSSLVEALERVRDREGAALRRQGQRIACITFTKRAVEVINGRLGFDDLYMVSTLHGFLWGQIGRFHEDMREALVRSRLPALIEKARAEDKGGKSKTALKARAKVERLSAALDKLPSIATFQYADTRFSDYEEGKIGHDDVIEIATYLFAHNATFRRITGLRFPYIFVDEAQDTFEGIVAGLNLVCAGVGLPIVGYFGDPWQQIYDRSAGAFSPPEAGEIITKTENFRCSKSVIRLLNAFRRDVEQYAAGDNKAREGSVEFRLVKAEEPSEPRRRYGDDQIERALSRMDAAIADWGWSGRTDVMRLFLARQMIARRLGFAELNKLFTGTFASSRAEEAFEAGDHFLIKPFLKTIYPLVLAREQEDGRKIVDILRQESPAFAVDGLNSAKSLKSMIETSTALVAHLHALWTTATVGEILRLCVDKQIIVAPDKLRDHLARPPREELYNDELHSFDKGDWLADTFFEMSPQQVGRYAGFIKSNTAYSTQHGVKGEEYGKVMVVYDDVEAAWNQYSFSKTLTPATAGEPTERQRDQTSKLAYVSFSRAVDDLRVLMFTSDPEASRVELIANNLLSPEQIQVIA